MKKIFLPYSIIATGSCRGTAPSTQKAEFKPNGIPMDWGNLKPNSTHNLQNESKLANTAAQALCNAASLQKLISGFSTTSSIKDAIVAVSLSIFSNDSNNQNHTFGDGQKNGSIGWIGWP